MGTANDEGRHEPTGEVRWAEVFDLGFWLTDGSLGGFVRFEIRPGDGVCWFWTSVAGADRRLVTVLEFGAAIPRWPGMELRGPSLWAELMIETPWEHVTLGLEAFAVELADPADVFDGCRGDLVPLGYDLEWESPPGSFRAGQAYEIQGSVVGEILVGEEVIDFEGVGVRSHSWGTDRAAPAASLRRDGLVVAPVELPGGERRAWVLDREGPYWADFNPRQRP